VGAVRLARHADDAISRPRVMSRACRPGSEPRLIRTAGDIEIASRASVFRAGNPVGIDTEAKVSEDDREDGRRSHAHQQS
jgi:hypothetical protein